MNDIIHSKKAELEVLNQLDLTKSIENDNNIKYFEREYINHHLDLIQNKTHKTLFLFLWRTGTRISEALNVRKKDIDLENYLIRINWLKKRKLQTRKIPLHPDLRNILDYYMTQLKTDDRLFNFSRQRADQLVKKYFKGNCHLFRHSFAINWLKSSGDLYLLSRMLGHSSIKQTEIYLQVIPADIGKELLKIKF